jgi:hypothetical protein
VIGAAITVAKIATGEVQDAKSDPGLEYARKGGVKGGKARAKSLTPQRRRAIAQKAARVRWSSGGD